MSKKAVVLLSGGLDSTTVLAIAKDEGFAPYALSFRYGQRHEAELEAAARVADAIGVEAARDRGRRPEHVRRLGAHRRDRRPQAAQRTPRWRDGIPVTYVPARNTVFLSFALAWAEVLEADDIFIGVNALDYSGYPDCRPEYIQAFEQMANLATKAAVEGRQRLQIHAPLIDLTKAQIIQRGLELGVDYGLTHSCYDPDSEGRACGTLRLLPASPQGLPRSRHPGPDQLPGALRSSRMTYTVKEIFYTLQGEGTHAGRPAVFCRFSGCNLWTGREEDRATAICNFCDTDFVGVGPDGGKFRSADDLADAVASRWPSSNGHGQRFVVCTGGEPLLQLDDGGDRCPPRARLRGRDRDQRHARAAAGHRLGLRQPEGRLGDSPAARQRTEARLPASRAPNPRAFETRRLRRSSSSSRWTGPTSTRTRNSRSSTASPTRSGSSACRPTSSSGSADGSRRRTRAARRSTSRPRTDRAEVATRGDLQGVHLRGSAPPPERP